MGILIIIAALSTFFNAIYCSTLQFSIEEEKPIGTLVSNIAISSGLSFNMSNQDFSTLQYKKVPNSGNNAHLFNVVENSGDIKTTAVIDRDELCKLQETCIITFDVTVLSTLSSFLTIYSIEISVTDKNDNIPTFPQSSITLEIPEDDNVGTLYKLSSAQDKDIGSNSIQGYEISSLNSTFELNVERNPDQSFKLWVELGKKLDREAVDFYQFHVTAKDGGSPPNIGTLTVHVKVMDYNDNFPEYQSDYNISVKENFKVGDTILQLLATDKDIGDNGRVSYHFSPHQSNLENIQQVFNLNSETGEITLQKEFDYGLQQSYGFYVDATDHGSDPKSLQKLVTIRVEDDGNNPPQITFNYLVAEISPDKVNISEGMEVGKPIAIVNVKDSDSGNAKKVNCQIDDNKFELQVVSEKYVVVIKHPLDREKKMSHIITITCTDQGIPPMSSQKSFVVRLADENDCIPEFDIKYAYFATISEGSPAGTVVTQVTATDCDLPQNSVIRYFLHADGVHNFAVDSITGVVKTSKVFDREINRRITFRVLAVDNGTPALTGTASIVMNITDINDNVPAFNVSEFRFHVLENKVANTFVGNLTAFDIDEGDNARLSYSLVDSNAVDLPFLVHPYGAIKTTRTLNREEKSHYKFKIVASDHGNPPKIAENEVIVFVDDDNDNYPVIHYPNQNNSTISIIYLEPVGSVIATVNASDRDTGVNAELDYSIVSGNQLGIFNINNKGQIILASTHIITEDAIFKVRISVKDKGLHQNDATQDVYIVLKYAKISDVTPIKDNSGNKYVIISAVVVAFTALVSAIIIAIICLLRRNDKMLAENSRRAKVMQANGNVFINGTVSYDPNHGDLYHKKKKEVSFSLEDDLDNAFDVSSFDDKDHTAMSTFDKPDKNNPLQFHQLLIQPDKQMKSLQKSHDTGSDTSAETIGSDSGRGGSESELPNSANNPDDGRTFVYNNRDFHHKCSSPFDGRPNRPFSDNYSHSAKNSGLTPRETFERKHKLNSSRTDNNHLSDRPKSDEWSPSYV